MFEIMFNKQEETLREVAKVRQEYADLDKKIQSPMKSPNKNTKDRNGFKVKSKGA